MRYNIRCNTMTIYKLISNSMDDIEYALHSRG